MSYENILVDIVEGGVGIITLNRPGVLNTLCAELHIELDDALTKFEEDDAIKAVIVTGAGTKACSAGHVIHEMQRHRQAGTTPPPSPWPDSGGI